MTKGDLISLIENMVDSAIDKKMAVITERFEEKMYASLGRRVISDSVRGGGRPSFDFDSGQPNNGARVDDAMAQMRVLENRVRSGIGSGGSQAGDAKKAVPNFLLGDQLAAALTVKGDYE